MNDRLRYEDELARQLQDLPLPDEDAAWADMKRRLEEDDDDGVIVPPFTWGCGGWALLVIVLLGLGWWIIRPEKWFIDRKEQKTELQEKTNAVPADSGGTLKKNTDSVANHKISQGPQATTVHKKKNEPNLVNPETSRELGNTDSLLYDHRRSLDNRKKTDAKKTEVLKKTAGSRLAKNRKNNQLKESSLPGQDGSLIERKEEKDKPEIDEQKDILAENDSLSRKNQVLPPDTLQNKIASKDSTKTIPDTVTSKTEKEKQKSPPKKYSFGTGLSLFQQIPIDGQSSVPYNSQGRKFSLSDYIPSVYARWYKENKWFIQTEFRYGAPQYTKQFTYGQKIVSDTQGSRSTITSQNLKKTFYHQLPVSFNYYVLPNLSLGAGFVWNKFYSAVYEQDITDRNNITQQDSTISKGILQTKRDSSLAKSYFQALFETQYKWKRFSLGARYSFGLQPYIKFSLPGSGQQEEKNSSLQVFLRYELWRSKNK